MKTEDQIRALVWDAAIQKFKVRDPGVRTKELNAVFWNEYADAFADVMRRQGLGLRSTRVR